MILCDRAPTIPKTTFSIENEMELKVEESLMMPAVFHTVASRTQLAVVTIHLTFTFRAFGRGFYPECVSTMQGDSQLVRSSQGEASCLALTGHLDTCGFKSTPPSDESSPI